MCMQSQVNCLLDELPDPGEQQRRFRQDEEYRGCQPERRDGYMGGRSAKPAASEAHATMQPHNVAQADCACTLLLPGDTQTGAPCIVTDVLYINSLANND